MGCDIHVCCEVKQKDGNWRTADRFKYCHYEDRFEVDHVYSDRNYALFSALAGVRDQGNEVKMLDAPRGVPEDISRHTREACEYYGVDGHSHSHCTLAELYKYQDENSQVTYKGLVSPQAAKAFDEDGTPPSEWCRGTSDTTFVKRQWTVAKDIMENLVKAIEARAKDEFWIFPSKDRVPADCAERFRIVFWFDN